MAYNNYNNGPVQGMQSQPVPQMQGMQGNFSDARPIVERLAQRLQVSPAMLIEYMSATLYAAKNPKNQSNFPVETHELIEYANLCLRTGLDPLLKTEVAPLCQKGRVQLIVMRDGMCKILRAQPNYNGLSFRFSDDFIEYRAAIGQETVVRQVPRWVECLIYLKNVEHPFSWFTPFEEAVVRTNPVWSKEPTNMLQIRAMMRTARNCFGLPIYDSDEAREIIANAALEESQFGAVQAMPQPRPVEKRRRTLAGAIEQKRQQNQMMQDLNQQVMQPQPVPQPMPQMQPQPQAQMQMQAQPVPPIPPQPQHVPPRPQPPMQGQAMPQQTPPRPMPQERPAPKPPVQGPGPQPQPPVPSHEEFDQWGKELRKRVGA